MGIKEAKYYKHQNMIAGIKLTLTDDSVHYVPRRNGNRHYQAILEWVAEGNTIEDAD